MMKAWERMRNDLTTEAAARLRKTSASCPGKISEIASVRRAAGGPRRDGDAEMDAGTE